MKPPSSDEMTTEGVRRALASFGVQARGINRPQDARLATVSINDYAVLYALFDCAVFKSATFEQAIDFYEYQRAFLETLCRTLV